jgi:hypothetical protein
LFLLFRTAPSMTGTSRFSSVVERKNLSPSWKGKKLQNLKSSETVLKLFLVPKILQKIFGRNFSDSTITKYRKFRSVFHIAKCRCLKKHFTQNIAHIYPNSLSHRKARMAPLLAINYSTVRLSEKKPHIILQLGCKQKFC